MNLGDSHQLSLRLGDAELFADPVSEHGTGEPCPKPGLPLGSEVVDQIRLPGEPVAADFGGLAEPFQLHRQHLPDRLGAERLEQEHVAESRREFLAQPDAAMQLVQKRASVDRGEIFLLLVRRGEPHRRVIVGAARVAREDDVRAAEVEQVAVDVFAAPLVDDPQQQLAHVGAGLLELVEQHHAGGQIADLRQQAALSAGVADVTGRDAEEDVARRPPVVARSPERVAVDADQGVALAAEDDGQKLGHLRLPHAGRTAEQVHAPRPFAPAPVAQPGGERPGDLVQDRVLPDDLLRQPPVDLLLGQLLRQHDAVPDRVLQRLDQRFFADLGRLRLLGNAPCAGLVEELDRLVGLIPAGQVLFGQLHRFPECIHRDPKRRVVLLYRRQTAFEDTERDLRRGRVDADQLEPPGQRAVGLDRVLVLGKRRAADTGNLAPRQDPFERLVRVAERPAPVHARLEQRVHLVDEQDDLGMLREDADQLSDPLLVLPDDRRPRAEERGRKLEDVVLVQPLRDGGVVVDDPPGQLVDQRRLARARIADHDRVVPLHLAQHGDQRAERTVHLASSPVGWLLVGEHPAVGPQLGHRFLAFGGASPALRLGRSARAGRGPCLRPGRGQCRLQLGQATAGHPPRSEDLPTGLALDQHEEQLLGRHRRARPQRPDQRLERVAQRYLVGRITPRIRALEVSAQIGHLLLQVRAVIEGVQKGRHVEPGIVRKAALGQVDRRLTCGIEFRVQRS